jgi:hypothetical protein
MTDNGVGSLRVLRRGLRVGSLHVRIEDEDDDEDVYDLEEDEDDRADHR